MAENVDSLVIAYLKEIRSRLDAIEGRMGALETRVAEGFEDQTIRSNGITMILTMLAGNVHGLEARVEALEARIK
jgi:BMFP domain-containing protein YqiC